MHNGRVNDVTYCHNQGKKCVPSYYYHFQATVNGRDNLPNAECRTPNAERRTPNAECRMPNAERRTPNAERRTQNAERRTQNAERRTQNAERRTQNAERRILVSGISCETCAVTLVHRMSQGYRSCSQDYRQKTGTEGNDCNKQQ